MRMHHAAGAVVALALAVPAAAQAHVTLQPKQAAAGAYVVEDVRVPNEETSATTTKVVVRFPDGFASVSYQPTPGWSVKVRTRTLATPVKTDDGEITEGVDQITWTADTKAAAIAPGQFRDFPLSLQVPGKAGDTLTFKALQTYSNGDIVRWIGPPDDDHPAPTVSVIAAQGAPAAATTPAAPSASAPAAASSGGHGASKGLGIAALVIAIVAALMAAAAAMRARPRGATHDTTA